MAVSYIKLFKLLIDRGMKKKELAAMADISVSTVTKMGKRDAVVSSDVLIKICTALECKIDDIVEIIPEEKATEVVAALIRSGDKFMICQRPAHKARGLLWEFAGGKVERGETKQQALIRECAEELAVTISVGDVFAEVLHKYPDITVHLTLFNAVIAEGVPQKTEHNDIRWITVAEIPDYSFCPADEEILKKLVNEAVG